MFLNNFFNRNKKWFIRQLWLCFHLQCLSQVKTIPLNIGSLFEQVLKGLSKLHLFAPIRLLFERLLFFRVSWDFMKVLFDLSIFGLLPLSQDLQLLVFLSFGPQCLKCFKLTAFVLKNLLLVQYREQFFVKHSKGVNYFESLKQLTVLFFNFTF